MWKSFYDFIWKASRMYCLPFNIAKQYILQRLKIKRLTPRDVVCYINWADGDCLTVCEIAKHLRVSHPEIIRRLQKIKRVWPHLFQFGPKTSKIFNKHRGDPQIPIDTINENEITRKF